MDFRLSTDQQDLQERARQLLDEQFSTTRVREAEASDDGFPRALWEAGVSLGWPETVGGRLADMCLLLEETGQAGATLPLVGSGVAATLLQHSPSGTLRDELLQAIAEGKIVAPAFIDQQGRNEWDTPRLPLRPHGEDFLLSGTKVLVPFASVADELLVTVITTEGQTAIVSIDPSSAGVSINRHQAKVGVPLSSVTFDDVVVPVDRLVHEGAGAQAALHTALQTGSLLATAEAIGFCEALIAMTAAYVSKREAFGVAIGTFQAVSHPCADMRVSADAVRILVQQAAWMVDNGLSAAEEIPATKALANELFETVANDAYRLHGALGFSNECDVQLFMRRLHGFFGSFGETQESFERAAAALGM